MATITHPFRRGILAAGCAAAIAICPMIAGFAAPAPPASAPIASCPPGQNEDPYTFACAPDVAPDGGVEQPDTTVQQSP
ncbi:MAG: hypothetical protein JO044_11400 [Mycobacteriaceae bacterium]|nr:hypothetical protein [Mycobacteriaceae bacterium]